jgi:hypothetical protein
MNSFDQFIKDSARSYLQSVVYIDDKIYLPSSNDLDADVDLPPVRDPFESAEVASNEQTPSMADKLANRKADDLESNYAHPKQLTESFAEMGIVCALYQPSENAAVDEYSTMFKLCQRADIVVLDWDLSDDDGVKVSKLIANLIKQSDEVHPHHVRLCAIYTNQPNLVSTAKALLANLLSAECHETKFDQDKLQLFSGATRISILGKPKVPGRTDDIVEHFVVEEQYLAKRLLDDFSEMHKGLLSGLALKGLSSIRKNTKRLLDKFTCDLDGSFILHRALVINDHEALEELPELLADELSAILEDSLLSDFESESVMSDFIDSLVLTEPCEGQFNEVSVRQQLKSGLSANTEKQIRNYAKMIGNSDQSSSEKLGLLYSNRTQYLSGMPTLKFGTIVKHKKISDNNQNWKYSICLMPICDSRYRSKSDTEQPEYMTFPFWNLYKEHIKTEPAALVIQDNHRIISLSAGSKIRDNLWLDDVKFGEDGWARPAAGTFKYEVIGDINEIHWVAQLKPLHAQRIALHVGSEASRVGVTESEWLRLVLKKSPSERPKKSVSTEAQPVSVIENRQTGDKQGN